MATTKRSWFYGFCRAIGRKEPSAEMKGFTLVEMLVVIAIVGILAGLAVTSFAGLSRKYRIDNQTRRMHSDLTKVRTMAMAKGRSHFIALTADGYTAYDDSDPGPDGDGTLTVGSDNAVFTSNQALNLSTVTSDQSLPITWSGDAQLSFNYRGLCSAENNTLPAAVCVSYSNANPRYDCIRISQTRIALGKLQGGGCSAANCRIQ